MGTAGKSEGLSGQDRRQFHSLGCRRHRGLILRT